MPRVAEALQSGMLAVEAADTLVGAAADTSPATVDNDLDLLAREAARPAELAARDIRVRTRKHLRAADLEAAHRRRVAAREAVWLGRSRRLASVDQRLMMAIRDGGCRH